MVIPSALTLYFVIALNGLGKHSLSRVTLVCASDVIGMFYSSTLGPQTGIQIMYFPLFCLPFVLFGRGEERLQLLTTGFTSLCYLTLVTTNFSLFPRAVISDIFMPIIYGTSVLGAVTTTVMCLKFYQKLNDRIKRKLRQSYIRIKNAYDEITRNLAAAQKLSGEASYARVAKSAMHEVKHPMGMIQISAQMALEHTEDRGALEDFARLTIQNVLNLNQVLHAIQHGQNDSHVRETFSTRDMLREVSTLSKSFCKLHGITIHLDPEKEAPEIYGHRAMIYQALINLVVNATQFTDRGGKILLQSETGDGVVSIIVKDTGRGISKENMTRIFEPYFTTQSNDKNLGLGLSLVRRVMEDHHGEVAVESELGKGTLFRLTFPGFNL